MALRKGWSELSDPVRRRYERAGITADSYAAGVNLEAARRGVNVTPAGGGREAAILKSKRAAQTPERKAQVRERERIQRARRVEDRRAQARRLVAWSVEHSRSPATQFHPPGLAPDRVPSARDLQRKAIIEYLNDYDRFTRELSAGWFGTRRGSAGGDATIIEDYMRKHRPAKPEPSFDRYIAAFV